MATLGANVATLADHAKRLDPDGKIARIAEMLSQKNELLESALFMEGNLPTGHRTTVRTGLPTVAWRLINGGVAVSKSTTAQVDEATGILEAYSEVDVDLAKLNGNTSEFRLSEAQAFLEAMAQEGEATFIYGDSTTAPEEFLGLANRYNSLTAANGQNIVDGGGTGSDNSSIWLIVWGANTVCGIYPKGSQVGLQHTDKGQVTVETVSGVAGSRMEAYRDHFQWKMGLCLKDWRYAVRIANIDISNLVAKSSAADLFDLMIKAMHRIHNLKAGKAVFYMNRSCHQMLDIQSRDDVISGGGLSYREVDGQTRTSFRGVPIMISDSLLETESQIT